LSDVYVLIKTYSEYNVERALAALPGKLGPHLVLWTAAEQQSLGVAYERVSATLS
jgi:hypothetical protein